MMHAYQEDRWLSVDEIANYLGVKPDTVYKWLARTEIPGHKVGRLWKFKTDEVDQWVRAGGSRESASMKVRGNRKLRK